MSKITCWITERNQKGKSLLQASGRTLKVIKLLKITIKIFNWPELLHQLLRPVKKNCPSRDILQCEFNLVEKKKKKEKKEGF